MAALSSARADFIISSATGPFEVSFRNLENTTYFGWTSGAFDADSVTESAEVLTTPVITVGTAVDGIGLNQIGTTPDILSGSNNIYNGAGANSNAASFQLDIPTSGIADSGFTTIIIQGNGLTFGGGGLTTAPVFGSINGVAPTFVASGNANGALQFWAKYELPGNAASYSVVIDLLGGIGVSPSSISDLRVDTQWSSTGYATDVAAVPEPGTIALFTIGSLAAVYGLRRRKRA